MQASPLLYCNGVELPDLFAPCMARVLIDGVTVSLQGSGGTASFGSGGGEAAVSGGSEGADNDHALGEPVLLLIEPRSAVCVKYSSTGCAHNPHRDEHQ